MNTLSLVLQFVRPRIFTSALTFELLGLSLIDRIFVLDIIIALVFAVPLLIVGVVVALILFFLLPGVLNNAPYALRSDALCEHGDTS